MRGDRGLSMTGTLLATTEALTGADVRGGQTPRGRQCPHLVLDLAQPRPPGRGSLEMRLSAGEKYSRGPCSNGCWQDPNSCLEGPVRGVQGPPERARLRSRSSSRDTAALDFHQGLERMPMGPWRPNKWQRSRAWKRQSRPAESQPCPGEALPGPQRAFPEVWRPVWRCGARLPGQTQPVVRVDSRGQRPGRCAPCMT